MLMKQDWPSRRAESGCEFGRRLRKSKHVTSEEVAESAKTDTNDRSEKGEILALFLVRKQPRESQKEPTSGRERGRSITRDSTRPLVR